MTLTTPRLQRTEDLSNELLIEVVDTAEMVCIGERDPCLRMEQGMRTDRTNADGFPISLR